jgi:hypothetical protein
MPHDDLFGHGGNGHSTRDHGTEAGGTPPSVQSAQPAATSAGFIPLAEPIPDADVGGSPTAFTPTLPASTIAQSIANLQATVPVVQQFPKFCNLSLPEGCYRLTYTPNASFNVFRGTLRVDKAGGSTVISGDLYRFLELPVAIATTPIASLMPRHGDTAPSGLVGTTVATGIGSSLALFRQLGIPIYPRANYYSYLKVTGLSMPQWTFGACAITLTAQEYVYTQPPSGSFNGTFPASPGTRTVSIVLTPAPAPIGFAGAYFTGRLYQNGADKGSIALGWVSSSFRRASIEIDTLTGAVAPQPVPAISGSGTESIQTAFATAGWSVSVLYDQTNVPVPSGVNPTACWSDANLHALMVNVRNPATNLDTDWHMHLVVVPATMGCGRGVMYDQIGVPREGVASFCDDGYPTSDSSNFGTAANHKQRNTPRAFLRSACHELGHGFNQIHQEQEGGSDNSLMTTTPSVANVLGGPATGAPGVFPDNINIGFNAHVRHHLVHFPDPVIRPGGMTFTSGHSSVVPQADRTYFAPEQLRLALEVVDRRIEVAEPLRLSWRLTNVSETAIPVPNKITTAAQHTFISVTNPHGDVKQMPSFVIRTDGVQIVLLEPGQSLEAETRVFWSSQGFAFETPGRYTVDVNVIWSIEGIPVGVHSSTEVWVNFPQTQIDNDAASTLLHREVGMFVALGGGAFHLEEAVARLGRLVGAGARGADAERPKALRGFEGLQLTRGGRAPAPSPGTTDTATKSGRLAPSVARGKPARSRSR